MSAGRVAKVHRLTEACASTYTLDCPSFLISGQTYLAYCSAGRAEHVDVDHQLCGSRRTIHGQPFSKLSSRPNTTIGNFGMARIPERVY